MSSLQHPDKHLVDLISEQLRNFQIEFFAQSNLSFVYYVVARDDDAALNSWPISAFWDKWKGHIHPFRNGGSQSGIQYLQRQRSGDLTKHRSSVAKPFQQHHRHEITWSETAKHSNRRPTKEVFKARRWWSCTWSSTNMFLTVCLFERTWPFRKSLCDSSNEKQGEKLLLLWRHWAAAHRTG